MKKILVLVLIVSMILPVAAETMRGMKFFLESGPNKSAAYANAYQSATAYKLENHYKYMIVRSAAFQENVTCWTCNLLVEFKNTSL